MQRPTQKAVLALLDGEVHASELAEGLRAFGIKTRVEEGDEMGGLDARVFLLPAPGTAREDEGCLISDRGARTSWHLIGAREGVPVPQLIIGWVPRKNAPKGLARQKLLEVLRVHQPATFGELVAHTGLTRVQTTNALAVARQAREVEQDGRTDLYTLAGWRVEVCAVPRSSPSSAWVSTVAQAPARDLTIATAIEVAPTLPQHVKDAIRRELELDAEEGSLSASLQGNDSPAARRLLSEAGYSRVSALARVDELMQVHGWVIYGPDSHQIKRILAGIGDSPQDGQPKEPAL